MSCWYFEKNPNLGLKLCLQLGVVVSLNFKYNFVQFLILGFWAKTDLDDSYAYSVL